MKVKSEREVAQSCPTLRHPMDCSPPGSSIHGIFQARVLEWGAIAFSIGPMRGPQRRAGRGTRPPLGLGWLPMSPLGTHGPCPLSSGPCVQRSQEARPSSTWSQGSHLALTGQRPKGRSPPAPTTPTPCPFPHAAPSARNASPCPAWHDQRRRRVLSASVPDRPPWAGTSPMTQGQRKETPTDFKATHEVLRSEEYASCGVL